MGIKLLFADDSVTMQRVIQLALEHEDFDLTIVGDGNAAYETACNEKPDLIIADVSMPGMDGFELCKKIKDNPDTAETPVVLISGEMEEYDELKGVDAGATSHITKPFKSGELIDTIKRLVEKSHGEAADASPAEKPALLELVAKPSAENDSDDEELEVISDYSGNMSDDDFDIKLDEDDLMDIENSLLSDSDLKSVEDARAKHSARRADFSHKPDETEKILSDVFDSVDSKHPEEWNVLDSPESEDELWNKTLRDLSEDTSEDGASAGRPAQPAFLPAQPSLRTEDMARIFRETAEKAVNDFLSSKAEGVLREELAKAVSSHVKNIFDGQYEKAFRDEIGKMASENFAKAMPQILETMEKITMQITPKLAEQMIKSAIEQIKGGEIN